MKNVNVRAFFWRYACLLLVLVIFRWHTRRYCSTLGGLQSVFVGRSICSIISGRSKSIMPMTKHKTMPRRHNKIPNNNATLHQPKSMQASLVMFYPNFTCGLHWKPPLGTFKALHSAHFAWDLHLAWELWRWASPQARQVPTDFCLEVQAFSGLGLLWHQKLSTKMTLHRGSMVVSWWFNAGLMVVSWWFEGFSPF